MSKTAQRPLAEKAAEEHLLARPLNFHPFFPQGTSHKPSSTAQKVRAILFKQREVRRAGDQRERLNTYSSSSP